MAYMLRKRILSKNDLDNAATWKEDLPDSGMVTAFELRINCNRHANRGSQAVVYPLESCISRIELIAESTRKVVSVSGQQLDFLNYIDFKRPNPRRYRQLAGGGNDVVLFLMGGRSLYDREYGFDMAKLQNAFLNYTYDLKEGTAEYFAANDHDITVYQWVWKGPDAPMFKGYFRTRQVLDYTTTGEDNLKTLKITPGLPLRRIIVQAKTRAKTLGSTWSALELEVNNGEYSPVQITSLMDWVMQQVQDYGLENEVGGLEYPNAGQLMELPRWWSYYETHHLTPYSGAGTVVYNAHLITLPAKIEATAAAGGEFVFSTRGWGFQKCLLIGFDHLDDGFDLLDTAGMSALKLILTEGDADLAGAVALQEVVLY